MTLSLTSRTLMSLSLVSTLTIRTNSQEGSVGFKRQVSRQRLSDSRFPVSGFLPVTSDYQVLII